MFQLTEQEIKAFVGPKAEYYLQKWQPELKGEGKVNGFNSAAFLLTGLWLPFRKMYLSSFLFLGAILIEDVLEELFFVGIYGKEAPASLGKLAGLITSLICGMFGNRWYLSHARKVISEVRAMGLPEDEYLRVLSMRGGTNYFTSIGIFALFIVLLYAVYFVLASLFVGA